MMERRSFENLRPLFFDKISLSMPSGTVRILVVDDEPALLESMRSYLSRLGHMVTAFRSATAAWESLASENPAVVIVDLTLQGMSGVEFIRKVIERHSAIAILATTGYPVTIDSLKLSPNARVAMLQKPFTPRMLTDALGSLLAAGAGAA